MRTIHFSAQSSKERRLIAWFETLGRNVKTLGRELKGIASEAVESKDPIKMAVAPFYGAAKVLLQGPDYLYMGVVDEEVQPQQGSETLHDIGGAAKNLLTLHPLRAAVRLLKVPGDVGTDVLKYVGGFHDRMASVLHDEQKPHYSNAA